MKYLYLLSVSNAETGEDVCSVEAYSQESLQKQLRKVDSAIAKYEEDKKIEANDESLCGKPWNHNNGEVDACVECAALKHNV